MEIIKINCLVGRSAQLDLSPVNIHQAGLYHFAPLWWYIKTGSTPLDTSNRQHTTPPLSRSAAPHPVPITSPPVTDLCFPHRVLGKVMPFHLLNLNSYFIDNHLLSGSVVFSLNKNSLNHIRGRMQEMHFYSVSISAMQACLVKYPALDVHRCVTI